MDKYKNKMRYLRRFNEGFDPKDYDDIVDILSDLSSYKVIKKAKIKVGKENTLSIELGNKDPNSIILYTHNDDKDSIEDFIEIEDKVFDKISKLGYTYKIIRVLIQWSEGTNTKSQHLRFIVFMNDDEISKFHNNMELQKFHFKVKDYEYTNSNCKIEIVDPKYYNTTPEDCDIIYNDDTFRILKPKSYKGLVRHSVGTSWDVSFAKNEEWVKKNISKGSYYGGYNWYKSKTIKKDINSWWRRLLRLPKKQVEKVVQEFVEDFPRYIYYIIEFKRFGHSFNKLLLVFDISRDEYGSTPNNYGGFNTFGHLIDTAHNNLRIWTDENKIVTLRYIHYSFIRSEERIFRDAFHSIIADYDNEKEKIYDILGVWADEGGQYKDNTLYFLRKSDEEDPNYLDVVKKKDFEETKDGWKWKRWGRYSDPNFDYMNHEMPTATKEVPSTYPNKIPDFLSSIRNNVEDLMKSLEDSGWKL